MGFWEKKSRRNQSPASHASSKIKQAQGKKKKSSASANDSIPPWARNIPKHKKKKK